MKASKRSLASICIAVVCTCAITAHAEKSVDDCEKELGSRASNRKLVSTCLLESMGIKEDQPPKAKPAKPLTPEQTAERVAKAEKKKQGVRIGMTEQDVLDSSWGRPTRVRNTTNARGIQSQWIYEGQNYLYFENGKLTTVQN